MKVGDRQGEQTRSSVSPPHVFCRVGKLEVESCSKGLQGQNKQRARSAALLQKILLSLKFPALRAKERGEGVEAIGCRESWNRESSEGRRNELQKCEALELKLCLPGPTESR